MEVLKKVCVCMFTPPKGNPSKCKYRKDKMVCRLS